MRSRRSFAAALLLLLLVALPARAAGTGGVDVSPYPGSVNGKQVTAFHVTVPGSGSTRVRYALRNTTDRPASARLFAASATRSPSGTFTIGTAGSSPYLDFPDHQVTLKPHESTLESFSVHGHVKGTPYGAVVVEVHNGSVIQQAATVVYLKRGSSIPLPLLLVLVAVGVLAVSGVGFLLVVRRRR